MNDKRKGPRVDLTQKEKDLIRKVCEIQQESIIQTSDINYDVSKRYREELKEIGIDPINFDLQLVKQLKQFDKLHKNPSKHLLRQNKANTLTIRYILHAFIDEPEHQVEKAALLRKIFSKPINPSLN